jgi:hypothetical protein
VIRARFLVFLVAVVVVLAACTSGAETTETTPPPSTGESTTTTLPDDTTLPRDTTTTTTATIPGSASESLDSFVVERIQRELGELMVEAEEVRGLPFLSTPTVVILDEAEFTTRVADLIAEELDEEEMAIDSRYLALLGMLPEGTDLYGMFIDLYSEQVAGFYDGDELEMVVPASPDGFTPLQRITVLHELVHALTDQHFDFNDDYDVLSEDGNGDDASALLALIEGDAQRASFVYMEGLSPLEAVQAATEAFRIESPVFDSVPTWMRSDLLFPYQEGLTFTDALIGSGGLAGVDEAYIDPPITTEQVLDFAKYTAAEGPRDLPPLTTELEGWEVHDEGSFGEWGLRLIIGESLSSGAATQAAAGWGNDNYVIYSRGEDVAVVIHYIGDAERDAEELADGLIEHAGRAMGAGAAVESGGGLLYDQGDLYVFIDRVEDELFFIAATDKTAGADLRIQLGL